MNKLKCFIKKEIAFIISGILAIITSFFVRPTSQYLKYIDFSVLIILFCLMACVNGLKKYGAFDLISGKLLKNNNKGNITSILLVMMCFFSSMIVTNDVALITFIPLTIYLCKDTSSKNLIIIITVETISANLGSLVTPIGNPQNLFLYNHYKLNIWEFFKISIPVGAVGLIIICLLLLMCRKCEWKSLSNDFNRAFNKKKLLLFCFLFIVCIATVLKIVPETVCMFLIIVSLFVIDRSIFFEIDYFLLLTFINFFIFVGNIGHNELVNQFVCEMIKNHEMYAGVFFSQIISNVPATILLASFTDNYAELFKGVNIGGLGTIVASLASLISFKYYSFVKGASKIRYLIVFTIVNVFAIIPLLFIFR